METVIEEQVADTSTASTTDGATVTSTAQTTDEPKVENTPYKVFASKEDFDKHSAGILNSAQKKAEKELLGMLGLKLDEKDKLAKFKQAYDATLSESEKQTESINSLNTQLGTLKNEVAEKNAIITALSKLTGKNSDDVTQYVRMARGLVDEETSIESALDKVLSFMKRDEPKANPIPVSKPLNNPDTVVKDVDNPFKTGNLTQQGMMIRADRAKAREMYFAVHGVAPNW